MANLEFQILFQANFIYYMYSEVRERIDLFYETLSLLIAWINISKN